MDFLNGFLIEFIIFYKNDHPKYSTLSKSSEFESYEDILVLIKQFAEEQHVYLRKRNPAIKVQCYNNKVKEEKKIDEKYIYEGGC